MSILIKGMEMPKDDCTAFRCVIVWNQWVDGEIKMYAHDSNTNEFIGEVINVPPHGRLVDADALTHLMGMDEHFTPLEAMYLMELIADAPTVIEAEDG